MAVLVSCAAGGGPVHVLPAGAQQGEVGLTLVRSPTYGDSVDSDFHGDSSWVWMRRGVAAASFYRRQRAPPSKLSIHLVLTLAMTAVVLLIMRCAFNQVNTSGKTSRRVLGEGDDYLEACGRRIQPSPNNAADAALQIGPQLESSIRSLLKKQHSVFLSAWRSVPKMISLLRLKTLCLLTEYAAMEHTVISGFLPDNLEEKRRQTASHLLNMSLYIVRGTPRRGPFSKSVYRLIRVCRFFSASQSRQAKLPKMTAEDAVQLLEEFLTVQHETWALIYRAMLELERWGPTPDGPPLEQTSMLVLFTVSGTLRIRRMQLLRIPAALYCLNELQEETKLRPIFGEVGIKKALACGPLPGAEGQIKEIKWLVNELVTKRVLGEESLGVEDERAQSESSGTAADSSTNSLPPHRTTIIDIPPSTARSALTEPAQRLLSRQFFALVSSSSLSSSETAAVTSKSHSSSASPPNPFQHAACSEDRPGVKMENSNVPFLGSGGRPFHGVPLGAPPGPWPPEGTRRPMGAMTPFDLSNLDFWARGLSHPPPGGGKG
ncbi:hypothetical protein, conserved [Eimeria maxima]|uniref:Transmembrane protein n=1 Tax=Eimeria maxima TaxID=5804 RepID=U6MJH3_EIMMA|nr:hypothetical protein, conserved [Eimeria maxima]CDJ61805.1 hypothetical protein, conserved [Eimeria maxima]